MPEFVRVCIKDIALVSGVAISLSAIRGSAWEALFPAPRVVEVCTLNRFSSWVKGVMAEMEEFLCLCLVLRRDVKFSSSGFMSGGRREIFLNTRTK